MGPKIKITNSKEEIELKIQDVDKVNEVLFEIENRAEKLKKIFLDNANLKIAIKVKDLSNLDVEKIKRSLIKHTEIVETRIVVKTYDGNIFLKKQQEILPEEPVQSTGENLEDVTDSREENLGLHSIKKTFESDLEISDTKYIRTNLRSGQRIEYEGSIVIIGDLNYGAEAVAGGNIIVTGTIRGLAHAGANGNKRAIIAGHEIENTQVRIANVVKEVRNTEGKLPFLYLDGENIVLEVSSSKIIVDNKSE